MKDYKKEFVGDSSQLGAMLGNILSENSHNATDEIIDGMNLFRLKAMQTKNVDFAQAKGNLFEYIESAKFNKDAALKKSSIRSVVTDAIGKPHDPADIVLQKNGKTVQEVQAKFIETYNNGRKSSAASSVFHQAGGQKGHWGKYNKMQRLIRKDENYNGESSLLDEAKRISKIRADSNSIHAKEYEDVYENLTDELNYKKENISSGGTTLEEVKKAYDNPQKYAKSMEYRQLSNDVKISAINAAKASAIMSGLSSGVKNLFDVFRDKKELDQALADVGKDVVKGSTRGTATGGLSSVIRFVGKKQNMNILQDSTAATVMAGGIIDCGVSIYSYARGELSSEELSEEIIATSAKSMTTVFYSKAIETVVGATNPFIPMAIYTLSSYVVMCTKEIINNAKLNAQEYDRLTSLLEESTQQMIEFHKKINVRLNLLEEHNKIAMDQFLNAFEYNVETGEDYDTAICAILHFSNQMGIQLQHVNFDDFERAMVSADDFYL